MSSVTIELNEYLALTRKIDDLEKLRATETEALKAELTKARLEADPSGTIAKLCDGMLASVELTRLAIGYSHHQLNPKWCWNELVRWCNALKTTPTATDDNRMMADDLLALVNEHYHDMEVLEAKRAAKMEAQKQQALATLDGPVPLAVSSVEELAKVFKHIP